MAVPSLASGLAALQGRRLRRAVAVLAFAFGAATAAHAQDQPAPTPVRWDQARVTKMAQDLAVEIHDAREAVRKSPMAHNIGQRMTYYELLETLRLAENTSGHLVSELEGGQDADQTRAVFERLSSLRYDAEEQSRKALVEAPVIDELVSAGAIHNQMKPYYYGKK